VPAMHVLTWPVSGSTGCRQIPRAARGGARLGKVAHHGNCTAPNVCTGGLTLDTSHNTFSLTAAPAGSGVAAIEALADANDSLTGAFSYSSGTVASPDTTVTVDNSGGTVSVTDTDNTIKVTH
jgi:hypothetical protein